MSLDFDFAVVGSGFAGSLTAMILRRLGRRVILIEKGRHPRQAIGESSTPLANLLLESLADRYDLPAIRAFSRWGTWLATHPGIARGLKRGFSFFHHAAGQTSRSPDRDRELLVAASPHDAIADTHWYRPDFDHFLVREAAAMGVEYADATTLGDFRRCGGNVQLEGVREGKPLRVRAGRVIDASGPRGFIHRTLGIAEAEFADYPATCAAYSHFTGVARWDEIFPYKDAPYPPDDAAVHHLFDGGWMWVLRFDNGLTSAGVVLDDPPPAGACEPEAMWARTLGRFPSLAVQFAAARPALPMRAIPRMAYRTSRCVGEGWAMLPMAAGFVDPLFSTGFALSLLGIERLAGVVELGSGPGLWEAYGGEVLADLDATASLIGAAHRVLGDPEGFRAVAMGYFAAVSFAETWRRLGKTPPAAFLLRDDPRFAEVRACWADAGRIPGGELHERVRRAVEPVNITGLCDAGKRNWYPVDARDLLDNAHRLGASAEEIAAMLRRAGFTA